MKRRKGGFSTLEMIILILIILNAIFVFLPVYNSVMKLSTNQESDSKNTNLNHWNSGLENNHSKIIKITD